MRIDGLLDVELPQPSTKFGMSVCPRSVAPLINIALIGDASIVTMPNSSLRYSLTINAPPLVSAVAMLEPVLVT